MPQNYSMCTKKVLLINTISGCSRKVYFCYLKIFCSFIYIEIVTDNYQNISLPNGRKHSHQHLKPCLALLATQRALCKHDGFASPYKILKHHMLYYVCDMSHVVERWRKTSHTVLRRHSTQALTWRTSTHDGVRRRRPTSIIVGLSDGRCLSQDNLGQCRTGPTMA